MGELMIKKIKNTAILNDDVKPVHKAQVITVPDSDYINGDPVKLAELAKYKLKAVHVVKGRDTVIEIYKD
jgi:hypothetical protein